MKNMICAAQFAAPYEGNFILSLKKLEIELIRLGMTVHYVFPNKCRYTPWIDEFKKNRSVYFTDDVVRSSLAVSQLKRIIHELSPVLVHTHFDGYDVSIQKAGAICPVVWHLHNYLSFVPSKIKQLYQHLLFYQHYGWNCRKNTYAISVCPEMVDLVCSYGFNHDRIKCIPNGIDLERIHPICETNSIFEKRFVDENPFIFLAMGTCNIRKRIDLLYHAGEILSKQKLSFKIWVTKGVDTEEVVHKLGGENSWFKIIEQQENINDLFQKVSCFVSSSEHETFSYAIAEATYFGLPVIQSDISGTIWNANNPSVFVFESENVADLERRMLEVMQAGDLSESCKVSSKFIKENYSLDSWVENILSFYRNYSLI